MSKVTINELAITCMILENYPGNDDLMVNGHTYAELKENLEVPDLTFSELEQVAEDNDDPLLLWIVREAKDGGAVEFGENRNADMYTVESVVRVIQRGEEALRWIINAFRSI